MTKNHSEIFLRHGPNLASYRSIGEMQDFWEAYWQGDFKALFQIARSGDLGEFEYPFSGYLPKDAPIIEAGCGRGKYVCALQSRGYQIEGIDYATKTVQRIHEYAPDICVREGDIYAIDRPDQYYAGYISIGVLEHNYAGPQAGIAEAYRVLRPGGIALISVPYLNWPRRQLFRKLPEAPSEELPNGLRFYQDHIDVRYFSNLLHEAGFEVLEHYPYVFYGGLIRDWSLGRWLFKRNFFHWRIGRLFRRVCTMMPIWIRRDLSHMMMFVSRK